MSSAYDLLLERLAMQLSTLNSDFVGNADNSTSFSTSEDYFWSTPHMSSENLSPVCPSGNQLSGLSMSDHPNNGSLNQISPIGPAMASVDRFDWSMITQSFSYPSPTRFGWADHTGMHPSVDSQHSPTTDFAIFGYQLRQPIWNESNVRHLDWTNPRVDQFDYAYDTAWNSSNEVPSRESITSTESGIGTEEQDVFARGLDQSQSPAIKSDHGKRAKGVEEEAGLLKAALEATRGRRPVRSDYICHNCYVQGQHHIKECPNPLPPDMRLTPYQGSGTCIGEFECPKCKRGWLSHKSECNTAEDCRKCNIQVYPFKQHSPEQALKCRLYEKPKYRKYAEKFGVPFMRSIRGGNSR